MAHEPGYIISLAGLDGGTCGQFSHAAERLPENDGAGRPFHPNYPDSHTATHLPHLLDSIAILWEWASLRVDPWENQ